MLIGISLMILLIGLIFKKLPPKKINSIYGYRTNSSMKNKKVWDYAQIVGANSFIVLGIIYGIIGGLFYLLDFEQYIIEMIIFISGFIIMFICDEKIIRDFDKE